MAFSDALHLLEVGATRQETLAERFRALHRQVQAVVPAADRLDCVLYDAPQDRLRSYVLTAQPGLSAAPFEGRLGDSPALAQAARDRQRVSVPDLRTAGAAAGDRRVAWLAAQGYRASHAVPVLHQGRFIGFVCFESCSAGAFDGPALAQLELHAHLAGLLVSQELATLEALVGALSVARDFTRLRDVETAGHLERMSRYAALMAQELGPGQGLDDEFVHHMLLFSPLHDIGKIAVPDRILLKPGPLDGDERRLMQTHVERGVETVDRMVQDFSLGAQPGIEVLRHIVAGHHEFLDGSGYPHGLRGLQIPIEARIATVADIYDALTSQRCYKPAWSEADAARELRQMALDGKLDAGCVEALLACPGECADIRARHLER